MITRSELAKEHMDRLTVPQLKSMTLQGGGLGLSRPVKSPSWSTGEAEGCPPIR